MIFQCRLRWLRLTNTGHDDLCSTSCEAWGVLCKAHSPVPGVRTVRDYILDACAMVGPIVVLQRWAMPPLWLARGEVCAMVQRGFWHLLKGTLQTVGKTEKHTPNSWPEAV